MAEEKIKRIKVTLAKAHTHGGKECAPGEVIEVTESQAARLRTAGAVATPANSTISKKEA